MNRFLAFAFLGVLSLVLPASMVAQGTRGVELGLTVSNFQGRTQNVAVGILEGASPGIDPTLGEAELPPQPPAEIFDVRMTSTPGKSQLGLGSLADYRAISPGITLYSESYTLAYQAGQGATKVKIEWLTPLPGRITSLVIDGVDMAGKTETEINFAQSQVTIVVGFDYSPLSFTTNPTSLRFTLSNRDSLPTLPLEIIPQGDRQAGWTLSSEATWLSITPGDGEGRTTTAVSVNTTLLPQGTYNSSVRVRSNIDAANLDVPVVLEMTVGVDDPVRPGDPAIGAYPNPFTATTRISVTLDNASGSMPDPVLKIYDNGGREVADLSARLIATPARQQVLFDASGLPAGMYTCVLRSLGKEHRRAITLVK